MIRLELKPMTPLGRAIIALQGHPTVDLIKAVAPGGDLDAETRIVKAILAAVAADLSDLPGASARLQADYLDAED